MATSTLSGSPFPEDMMLTGDARYVTDVHLRLTKTDDFGNPQTNSWGRAIKANPVALWQPGAKANFETTIKFKLSPKTNNDIPADGLVFFMVPTDFQFFDNSFAGNLGIFDPSSENTKVFAVEFDIFSNKDWDPDYVPHLGIDILSKRSKITAKIPYSFIGKDVIMKINYVANPGAIEVTATNTDDLHNVPLRYNFDLSTILPRQVQVGLAASTGNDAAIHDVFSWEFSSRLV